MARGKYQDTLRLQIEILRFAQDDTPDAVGSADEKDDSGGLVGSLNKKEKAETQRAQRPFDRETVYYLSKNS